MTTPSILKFGDIDWVDESGESGAPSALVEEAAKTGARRKRLVKGEGGFYCQYSSMPAGFAIPGHTHSFDELLMVLSGGCTLTTDGVEGQIDLTARDSVVLAADHEYGFEVGPEGMEFVVIRTGDATSSFAG